MQTELRNLVLNVKVVNFDILVSESCKLAMMSKVVLVSGCSSGIGLATAVHLARDEEKRFRVYATMRNLAKKEQLEEEANECLGDTLVIKQMDVCCDESVNKAVKEILDTEGKIDVLFNNAGIGLWAALECTPIDMAKEMYDINFFGAVRLIQAVLPGMKARRTGHIINNSSHLGIVGVPFNAMYCSTKFALEGLTEALAPTLLHFNIRCSLVEEGPVSTSALTNSRNWASTFDMPTADQKTQELFGRFAAKMEQYFVTTAQSSDDIAKIVKGIILSEKPSLRYQTNEKYRPHEIKAKLVDPSGNFIVEMMKEELLDEK
ncbi:retinol dehydrogenase 8-like [Montipora capricornis]|uniref:retinol dehydrogenase 8-like n=1 Tax=Montipora foliosa TaxID=591990 RepID=UPI0035F1A359